jgi:Flp pilus assembly protein TadG
MSRAEKQKVSSPKTGWKNEAGQASVEFALTIVFLVLLIFGIIEMVMMLYTYNVLADSAKEGVRYAVVHGNLNASPSGPSCPCSAIDGAPGTGLVKTYAQYSLHDTSTMTVTVTYPDTANPPANQAPNRVRVEVSYPYQPFFGLGWPTVTVRAAAEGRIMY